MVWCCIAMPFVLGLLPFIVHTFMCPYFYSASVNEGLQIPEIEPDVMPLTAELLLLTMSV